MSFDDKKIFHLAQLILKIYQCIKHKSLTRKQSPAMSIISHNITHKEKNIFTMSVEKLEILKSKWLCEFILLRLTLERFSTP